ncbi:MAG: D-aminoacyl-tRNA deacylase [Nitrospirota bacterium]
MIALLQRVSRAGVEIDGAVKASIGRGMLVLLCAVKGDGDGDIDYMVRKLTQLRIFEDEAGKMNRSVTEINGEVLVVPQFTLAASTKKGNRPSFDAAEAPERACELCDAVVKRLSASGLAVQTGVFGAMMAVSLVNDGPVTVLLDSRE